MSDTINPPGWPRPSGYSNGVVAEGRFLAISGQIGWDETQRSSSATTSSRKRVRRWQRRGRSARRRRRAVASRASDLVRHRQERVPGECSRHSARRTGRSSARIYPAMALVQVAGLLEEGAKVEIEATAVLPRSAGADR